MTGNPEKKQDQRALQAVKREMGPKCTVGTLKWGAHRIMNRRVFSFRAQGGPEMTRLWHPHEQNELFGNRFLSGASNGRDGTGTMSERDSPGERTDRRERDTFCLSGRLFCDKM